MATLLLTRKPGESLLIDLSPLGIRQSIRITLLTPPRPGNDSQFKIEAPPQLKILREELAIRDARRGIQHVRGPELPPRQPGTQRAGDLD